MILLMSHLISVLLIVVMCFQAPSGHGVMGIMANLAMVEAMAVKLPRLLTNYRALVLYGSFADHSFLWH